MATEQALAHRAVAEATETGVLPWISRQVCVACGEQASDWPRHRDYAPEHRLDVRRSCRVCHVREHKAERGGAA